MLVKKGAILFNIIDSRYYKVILADEYMFCAVAFEDDESGWMDINKLVLKVNMDEFNGVILDKQTKKQVLNNLGFEMYLDAPINFNLHKF